MTRGSARRFDELSGVVGIVAAIIVAVLLNVVFARHYRRWDCTRHRLYTLAPPTLETLAGLSDEVRVDVLLPSRDPLTGSIRALLAEYQARTQKLRVVYTDPDWHPAEFLALQQKYGIVAGRTENGQVVTDAAIVLSTRSSKPFFLSPGEFVDISEDEQRARSRMEQAFTLALRGIVDGERPRLCFVVGHGEARIGDSGPRGLGALAARLRKNNYDVDAVETAAGASSALDRCRVAIIAAPTQPFPSEESEQIAAWFRAKGSLLLLAGPVPDPTAARLVPLGLSAVAAAGGVALDDDFVFEPNPARKLPNGIGDQFVAEARAHRVTAGLVGDRGDDLRVLLSSARSLSVARASSVVPAELLRTSRDAFALTDFFAWVKRGGPPEKGPGDLSGPLALAMASELPLPKSAPPGEHGPRMVVVGASSPALAQSWEEPALRGAAVFTESAVSWLAARPSLVDIPDRPAALGVRVSEDKLGEVWRYVVVYVPTAIGLLGLAVYLRRRATEGRARRPLEKPGT